MKKIKYIVKMPLTTTEPIEYKEIKFYDKKDVCEFLNINYNTFTRISNGTMQCIHQDTQKFYGIKIEKIKTPKRQKVKETTSQLDKSKLFVQSLLEKPILTTNTI
jgi:hypothetical protein